MSLPAVIPFGMLQPSPGTAGVRRSRPFLAAFALAAAAVVIPPGAGPWPFLVAPVHAQLAPSFSCPMHPDFTTAAAGVCGRCGMALVPNDALDAPAYELALETSPPAPRAGSPVRLRFSVRHPETRELVRELAIVHEKPFHLFVISHDLEEYQHIHPERQDDGAYALDVVLPKPGYYKLFADFLPAGGTPQVIPGLLVTADAPDDLAAAQARLVPDATLRRTADALDVTLTLPAGGLVAGREERLAYRVRDAVSGAPVEDIEPYLGAFGHALVMSEDTLHYVHAHPVEALPAGEARPRGGPEITFKALLPKPGRYRIWVQLQRAGNVTTVPFTVEAVSPTGGLGPG